MLPLRDHTRFQCVRWSLYALLAMSFFLGYFCRIAPSVMTAQLMVAFQVNAAALGSLVAMYFYIYTAMQMPAGVLVDAWGPRLSAGAGVAVTGLGAVLFGLAPIYAVAGIGRFLVGLGTSTIFISILKVNDTWFDERHYAALGGLTIFIGNSGATFSAAPLAALLRLFTWREVFVITGIVMIVLAILILLFVHNRPEDAGYTRFAAKPVASSPSNMHWTEGLSTLLHSRQAWAVFWAGFGTGGTFFGFAGLWGVPLLMDVFGLDRSHAAVYTSLSLGALAFGALLMGWLSDRAGRRKPFMIGAAVTMGVIWLSLIFLPWQPGIGAAILYTGLGLASAAGTVVYAAIKEALPPSVAGMSVALANTGLFLGAAITQPLFGWLLDLGWQGRMVAGVRHYSMTDYRHGLWLFLALTVVSLVACAFLRETHARQAHPENDHDPASV